MFAVMGSSMGSYVPHVHSQWRVNPLGVARVELVRVRACVTLWPQISPPYHAFMFSDRVASWAHYL